MRTGPTLAAFLVTLCLSSSAVAQGLFSTCTVISQNLFVRDAMSDIYLWYKEIPNLDPATFDSPEEYLEAIRYRPLDSTFSYITSRAANDALFSNSEYVGFGFSSARRDDELVISQVFPQSPAQQVGLRRGDRIVEIDGRTVAQLIQTGEIDEAFGPPDVGVKVDIVYLRGESRQTGRMFKREVVIPTVSDTRVIDVDGRRVGYIFFRNFVEPSVEALDEAFADLRRQGVTELVLDLRYNGGGLVNVAQHLAGLIGGAATNGQVFAVYSHNDRNEFRNRTLRFALPTQALRLERLLVITTRASASASELVINSLRPFMPVVVIGDRTYGKPVGQYQLSFCDIVLAPVSFTLRNADGQGDFFDGLAPTCSAADDLNHAVGDPAEASLSEALFYLRAGTCSGRQTQPRTTLRGDGSERPSQGWQSVVGAH